MAKQPSPEDIAASLQDLPQDSNPQPGAQSGPPVPTPATLRPVASKDDGKAQVSSAKRDVQDYLNSNPDAFVDKSTGQVKVTRTVSTGGTPVDAASLSQLAGETNPNTGKPYKVGDTYGGTGKTETVVDPEGTALYRTQLSLEQNLSDFVDTNGGGAARSYLSTEQDKQDEVTRQFKDFLARANETYNLQDAEQQYSMNADDQNAKNASAMMKGELAPGLTTYYSEDRPYGGGLSDTVRRTVPMDIPSDYQTNAAVGLPGGEGFSPNVGGVGKAYAYAFGTKPKRNAYYYPKYAMGTQPQQGGKVIDGVYTDPANWTAQQQWLYGKGPLARMPARLPTDPPGIPDTKALGGAR